jgi:hypothetical protein
MRAETASTKGEANVPRPAGTADSPLSRLGRNFQELKQALARTMKKNGTIADSDWMALRDHSNAVDRNQRELFALASASVAMRAGSLDELKVKAEILLEYADPDASDIGGRLIAALCRDVLALAARAKEPAQ